MIRRRIAVIEAELGEEPRPVAALLGLRAIGVVDPDRGVEPRRRRHALEDAIGPDPGVPIADRNDPPRRQLDAEALAVDDEVVIAKAVAANELMHSEHGGMIHEPRPPAREASCESQAAEQVAPARPLAGGIDERTQRGDARAQLVEEARVALAALEQARQAGGVADVEVPRIAVAEDAERARDARRQHRD